VLVVHYPPYTGIFEHSVVGLLEFMDGFIHALLFLSLYLRSTGHCEFKSILNRSPCVLHLDFRGQLDRLFPFTDFFQAT